MKDILHLPMKSFWFHEIKAGRKTHEYRDFGDYWAKRITTDKIDKNTKVVKNHSSIVRFQNAFGKNPEHICYKIKKITIIDGKNTDLKAKGLVFDIELGAQVKC